MSALVTDPKQQKLKSKLLVPDKGAVYDFRWERTGTRWEHWMDTIPTYKVPDGASFQVRARVWVGWICSYSYQSNTNSVSQHSCSIRREHLIMAELSKYLFTMFPKNKCGNTVSFPPLFSYF